jgi:hypothetical protein
MVLRELDLREGHSVHFYWRALYPALGLIGFIECVALVA